DALFQIRALPVCADGEGMIPAAVWLHCVLLFRILFPLIHPASVSSSLFPDPAGSLPDFQNFLRPGSASSQPALPESLHSDRCVFPRLWSGAQPPRKGLISSPPAEILPETG